MTGLSVRTEIQSLCVAGRDSGCGREGQIPHGHLLGESEEKSHDFTDRFIRHRACTMSLHSTFARLTYVQKARGTPLKTTQKLSFCTSTLLDQSPRHMRHQRPSILFLQCFQLDRRPATGLEQVLSRRAIQLAITHSVWPDEIIDHFRASATTLLLG